MVDETAAKVDEFGHRRSPRWTDATTDTKVRWTGRTVRSILSHAAPRGSTKEANVRTTLYTTIGAGVAALALGGATLAGQHAHPALAGAAGSNAAHTHIGHVMTMWKDTPNTQGFLPVAVADAKVAATHAELMQKSPDDLDLMKLHAGHVLHALDPTVEAKGPGSGYGLKRAAARALQQIQLAAKSEGASRNVQTHAAHVSASLSDVTAWTDQAIATAQKIRAATSASEAAALVTEVIAQTSSIANGMDANKDGSIGWQTGEGGLAQAQTHMDLMVKGEGL